jgi:hypothetical protein
VVEKVRWLRGNVSRRHKFSILITSLSFYYFFPIFGASRFQSWFAGLVVGGLNYIRFGLSTDELETKNSPNQGIRRSLYYSVLAGLAFGLPTAIVLGIDWGWTGILVFCTYAVPIGALRVGGRAVLQHYTLRYLLYRNNSLPFRLVPFLDYCAERIFLCKVGGGYIFIHRLLMEHFASLYTEQPKKTQRV